MMFKYNFLKKEQVKILVCILFLLFFSIILFLLISDNKLSNNKSSLNNTNLRVNNYLLHEDELDSYVNKILNNKKVEFTRDATKMALNYLISNNKISVGTNNYIKDKKLIAFTFDDGPSIYTNKLLDNLDKYNAKVTFFVVGSRVNTYRDTLLKAHNKGNQIGNHTYNHPNLTKLGDNEILKEVDDTNNAINGIIGKKCTIIRPPYGSTNNNIKNLIDMNTIIWDIDTQDWKYKDSNKVYNTIVSNAHDGAIILLHDLYETSIDGALRAMDELQKQGYAFVTIDEMVKFKNIDLDKNQSYYNFK